jgi:hypothetical protein
MKLPSRLSTVLGTLILGGEAIAGEVTMSHPLHQAVILAGGALLFLLHPTEGGVITTPGTPVPDRPPGI